MEQQHHSVLLERLQLLQDKISSIEKHFDERGQHLAKISCTDDAHAG